jgi:ribokinase
VLVTRETPTGMALISVDAQGENSIVVSPGANARVTAPDVESAAETISEAEAVLLQLEIPLEAVVAAATVARGRVILNPAPARPLPPDLLARMDVLVPNRSELAALAEAPEPSSFDDVAGLVRALEGPRATVVTLGSEGAAIFTDGRAVHVPAIAVTAVDTTAGGDCFCGALADALVDGAGIEDATRWAVRAAAVAITRRGAQSSLPTREEVEALG